MWNELQDGSWQREDGMLVVPGPDGGWVVMHPAGDEGPTFDTREAAMEAAGPAPEGEWVN